MSLFSSATGVFRDLSGLLPPHWRRRRGLLGPPQVLISLMTMSVLGCKGYERTLDEMKRRLGEVLGWPPDARTPSGQALSQARRKLTAQRCREVVAEVQARCTTARSQAALGYGGLRLLALDGTKVALPAYRALRDHFGCPTQAPMGPQASLTMVWDVGANQPVDWKVGPYRECERLHAYPLVTTLRAGDLLLADRNFASMRFMFALRERHVHWLMRVRCAGRATIAEVSAFVASGLLDQVVCIARRNGRGIPTNDLAGITVRLLRMELKDGTTAVFITSLIDGERHTAAALIKLYSARWCIETAFRELKIWHGLERFHARYPDGICQEIAALMLFQLLSSELEAQARVHQQATINPPEQPDQPAKLRRPALHFNRRIVADCALNLLYAATCGPGELAKAFDDSLYRIWRYRRNFKPKRRSFPRECKSPARGWKEHGKRKSKI